MLSIDMLSIPAELVDLLLPKCIMLLPEAELILCMGGEDPGWGGDRIYSGRGERLGGPGGD